jgi:hypothetical protein
MDVSIIRVGAAEAEEFPGRIHHRAAAGLPGRWRANQSHEVACFWSAELNGKFNSAVVRTSQVSEAWGVFFGVTQPVTTCANALYRT